MYPIRTRGWTKTSGPGSFHQVHAWALDAAPNRQKATRVKIKSFEALGFNAVFRELLC